MWKTLSDLCEPLWQGNQVSYEMTKTWPEGDPWNTLFARCESPIERRMCIEISERLGYPADAGEFLKSSIAEPLASHGAVVFSQHPVGRFRVDFLIAMWAPGWHSVALAAVECDGHEFHSAAEQKLRDEIRDVELSGYGLKVIRFSGHEIMRRAEQVLGRIPEQMGARITDFHLWGSTQRELYADEFASARRQLGIEDTPA